MDSIELASKHSITFDGPAPGFFQGALLGNGGLGVVVTTRPDAICFHLAHNNVWDIRIKENHIDKIGTFDYVYKKIKAIDPNINSLFYDPWYKEYSKLTSENYSSKYPRPFPCGTLMLFFERRKAEILGHNLDISTGLLIIKMLIDKVEYDVKVIVQPDKDVLKIKCFKKIFNRVRIIPEEDIETELPKYEVVSDNARALSFTQIMPFQVPEEREVAKAHPKDKKFSVTAIFNQDLNKYGDLLEGEFLLEKEEEITVYLQEGLYSNKIIETSNIQLESFEASLRKTSLSWAEYWQKSCISMEDEFFESVWYRNNYFMNCATSERATCPGLFANWMHKNIGTEWHGDYHFNYNVQQPFWGVFSSNHPEKHLAYVSLIEHMLPVSKKWAKDYYNMSGAFYPHSAYPVEMNILPYPVPGLAWEICETPWAVQSLWWHYLYTGNKKLLHERLFLPIKEAVSFLVDYMTRAEAHGPQWGDEKYHVFPTVVPELYELTPGFKMNADCIVDLTLIKFIFKAYIRACEDLSLIEKEETLIVKCKMILENYPEYSKVKTSQGTIFLNVEGEDPEVIQNVPSSNCPVFPGEEIGLDSQDEEYEIAVQTWLLHRNEGGNDLVFYNLQGARLGILDLERFKRQIKYCMMPNGTCGDRVIMSGGRYSDDMDFDFMMNMGIWFENFSLPAVINDCLLHGYNDIIRLFPNWPLNKNAAFTDLRTVGAFLVSAACSDGKILSVEVFSEKGGILKMHNPWNQGAILNGNKIENKIIELQTQPNQKYVFINAAQLPRR